MDAIGTNAAGATSNALVASSNALVANATAGQASSNALVASSNALVANATAGVASSNALVASSNALVANATAGQASSNALVASSNALLANTTAGQASSNALVANSNALVVLADTDDIQTRLPAALVSGRIDASVGAVAANAITAAAIADGAIDRATLAADTGLQTIRSNTAQAGASTTLTLDSSASASDDFYNNTYVYVTGGTGVGQARFISGYNGSSKIATVNAAWVTNPSSDSTFAIIAFSTIPGASAPTAAEVADAVWDEAQSGHTIAGSFGALAEATNSNALLASTNAGTASSNALVASSNALLANTAASAASSNALVASSNALVANATAGQASSNALVANSNALVVLADTNDIQTRLPAALVSGRMDASVGAVAADAITSSAIAANAIGASELAADAVAEIADAVWEEAQSDHTSAGTFGIIASEIADILTDTGTTLDTAIAAASSNALVASSNALQANTTAGAASSNALVASSNALQANTTAGAASSNALVASSNALVANTTAGAASSNALVANATAGVASSNALVANSNALVVLSDTNDIQTRLPAALVGGRMDSNVSALNNVATAAARIARSTQGIVLGTVGSSSTTSNIVTSSLDPAAAASDQLKGRIVTFEQGTTTVNLRGQSTDITASTPAGALTVTPLTTAPVSGDVFIIT